MDNGKRYFKIIWLSILSALLIACGGGGGGGGGGSTPPPAGSTPSISFATTGSIIQYLFPGTNTYPNVATSSTNPNGSITYASSDTAVATVVESTGTVTLASAGTTTITASVTADGNYAAGSTSYSLTVTNEIPFTAWIGSSDTKVGFPAATSGLQFYSETTNDCTNCGGYSFNLNGTTVTDTTASLSTTAYYTVANSNGEASQPATVSQSRFSGRSNHQLISFKNKLWLTGGHTGSAQAQAGEAWSSSNGEVWAKENSSDLFGSNGIHKHQIINPNDTKMIVLGGVATGPIPTPNPNIYTSTDGKTWSDTANPNTSFDDRYDHAISAFNGQYWLTGGFDGSNNFSDSWYSSDGESWTQATPTSSYTARRGHQTAELSGNLWMVGGINSSGSYLNDVWSFDGTTWTQQTTPSFAIRAGHTLTAFNNKLWLIGGNNSTGILPDIWSFDGTNWVEVTTAAAFGTLQDHSVTAFNSRLWLSAGKQTTGGSYSNEVWSSADGSTWVLENSPSEFTGRSNVQASSFSNKLWIFGGASEAINNDRWSSDDGVSWSEQSSTSVFSARSGHQVANLNGTLWLSAGQLADSSYLRDTWHSDNGTDWTRQTSSANFPARSGHQMLSFDSQLWIFGGQKDASTYSDDVWSSSDGGNWTQRSSGNVPSGLKDHQAVVYDNTLWVIGGKKGSGGLANDIRTFNPTDDTWSTVTTSGTIFTARSKHRVVSFKNKMFLIGGQDASSTLNDIWTSTNGIDWTQQATPPFPARHSHSIVKNSGELYLIGGEDASGNKLKDVWKSADGITWRRAFSNSIFLQ